MTGMKSIARKIKQDLKNDLIAGLLVVIPLATTIWLSYTVALWAIDFFTSIPKQFNPFGNLDPLTANLLNIAVGFSVPLLAILLIGLMARNIAGRWLLDTGENIVASIPLAGAIYKTLQQILETLFKDSKSKFRRVVMIEYPRQGVWSIGFVTGTIAPSVQANLAKPCLSVFIPTTPNPTSGWYAIVPEEEAITLDLSIEDAFKILISGGIVSPNTAPSLPIDFSKTRSAANAPLVAIDDPV
ncbi:DUF502 domain-containing protein [Pannus brasiliensis CCIBt3594]|uniref:DUF502 domain-containing protein n=1 Tax=Pannus brasiliensis CCIBt3594 TaxID=1427578 RepID=A0AAW9QQ28_9CHRO